MLTLASCRPSEIQRSSPDTHLSTLVLAWVACLAVLRFIAWLVNCSPSRSLPSCLQIRPGFSPAHLSSSHTLTCQPSLTPFPSGTQEPICEPVCHQGAPCPSREKTCSSCRAECTGRKGMVVQSLCVKGPHGCSAPPAVCEECGKHAVTRLR